MSDPNVGHGAAYFYGDAPYKTENTDQKREPAMPENETPTPAPVATVPNTKREAIYDEHIAPLMARIIEVCKREDIPLVCSFQLNDDRCDDPNKSTDVNVETGEPLYAYFCTTVIIGERSSPSLVLAAFAMKPELFKNQG